MSLLNNRHIELNDKNDLFGTVVRAKSIQAFFELNSENLGQNNMFALYGNWGSGKSSVLKYLENHLDKEKYQTLFFDTWEYEKDENLPLSLLHFVTDHIHGQEQLKDDILRTSLIFLKNLGKGITFKFPGIEFSNEKFLKSLDEELEVFKSFHSSKADFKRQFRECEDKILGKDNDKKLLIFIDDIDRCEPENVLNLISAIKLFFTYGKRVIFLFALDEDAVYSAIQTKYKDAIKADEYLEKVFDMVFYMPSVNPTQLLIQQAFPGKTIFREKQYDNALVIDHLFQFLNFNTPRHIKKIINKYKSLCALKSLKSTSLPTNLIPDLLNNEMGSLQETILCLFFIVLYEYYPDEFEEIEDFKGKIAKSIKLNPGTHYSIIRNTLNAVKNFEPRMEVTKTIKEITNFATHNTQNYASSFMFYTFLFLFTPTNITEENTTLKSISYSGIPEDLKSYERNILMDFCDYLILYNELFTGIDSQYRYHNLFVMSRLFL